MRCDADRCSHLPRRGRTCPGSLSRSLYRWASLPPAANSMARTRRRRCYPVTRRVVACACRISTSRSCSASSPSSFIGCDNDVRYVRRRLGLGHLGRVDGVEFADPPRSANRETVTLFERRSSSNTPQGDIVKTGIGGRSCTTRPSARWPARAARTLELANGRQPGCATRRTRCSLTTTPSLPSRLRTKDGEIAVIMSLWERTFGLP